MMKRRTFLKTAGWSVAALTAPGLLAGCAQNAPLPGPVPEVGFSHLEAVSLNVGRLDISSDFSAPLDPPHVEHRMPTPPAQAMQAWARARLTAAGGDTNPARASFVVEDAAVIEVPLEKTKGFKGLITTEAAERYEASVRARLRIEETGRGYGTARASAKRTIEIHEDATLAEREQKWVELVENLMADFDQRMMAEMDQYLSRWIMP